MTDPHRVVRFEVRIMGIFRPSSVKAVIQLYRKTQLALKLLSYHSAEAGRPVAHSLEGHRPENR